jgi:hypothetical protein
MVDIPLCSLISLWNLELNWIADSHFQFRVNLDRFLYLFCFFENHDTHWVRKKIRTLYGPLSIKGLIRFWGVTP